MGYRLVYRNLILINIVVIMIVIMMAIIIIIIIMMTEKRGFVSRNRGVLNSNTGPCHTNKKRQKYILKQPDTEELRRRCGKESETIQHITAACEQLASTEYVKRHDQPKLSIRNWQKQPN